MPKPLETIAAVLTQLGLDPVVQEKKLAANTHLVQFRASEEAEGLRLECRLLPGVRPSKLALWNLVHHNNSYLPFGQFYISPEHAICFGCQLPAGVELHSVLDRMVLELLRVGEGYYQILRNDFEELPFLEEDYRVEAAGLFRERFAPAGSMLQLTRDDAAQLLEALLRELFPAENVHSTGNYEFTLVATEHLTTLKVEPVTPQLRQNDRPNWVIGLTTDAGLLERTDNRLWILLNRLNYNSFLLAYGVRYQNRRPVISLNTGLPAESIQHPEHLKLAVLRQQELAASLPQLLGPDYRLKSLVASSLGL
jgi:hypothetical protein